MVEYWNGVRTTTSRKKPSGTSVKSGAKEGDGDNARSKKSRYENKIIYYLGKVMKTESRRENRRSTSREVISNDLLQRYKDEQKRKKKRKRYFNFSKNKKVKPQKKATHIVNTTINYGLKNGILSKKGKYYYFTNDKPGSPDTKKQTPQNVDKQKDLKPKSSQLNPNLSKEKSGDNLKYPNKRINKKSKSLINQKKDEEKLMHAICRKPLLMDRSKFKKETGNFLGSSKKK